MAHKFTVQINAATACRPAAQAAGLILALFASPLFAEPPIAVSRILMNGEFGSFINRLHPDNRIGYRFHEHRPYIYGAVPRVDATTQTAVKLMDEFRRREGTFVNSLDLKSTDGGWVPQTWTFHLRPVEDGIEMLWVIGTGEAGLNEYFAVQQCFRMSGRTNEAWRHEIAETPAFSEYDLWARQDGSGESLTSLAWVLRRGEWSLLPATREHVGCRTPLGLEFDRLRTGNRLEKVTHLEPYGPTQFQADVDDGLITRLSTDGKWVCGLFWERTTHVSDHHPADCLHAIVNLGPMAPRSQRAIRGKIYWARMTRAELKDRWAKEFPDPSNP